MTFDPLNQDLPLASLQAWKKWDGIWIWERFRGKSYLRIASEYDLSPKPHLEPYQPKFADAVAAWQNLSAAEKKWYHSRAAALGLQLPGYNYFLSLYLRDKI